MALDMESAAGVARRLLDHPAENMYTYRIGQLCIYFGFGKVVCIRA